MKPKFKTWTWLKVMLTVKGSVLPTIWGRTLFCGLFATAVSGLYAMGVQTIHQPTFGSIVPSIVLGLLLVFRTNTAYDRFWEGRRSWGAIVNNSRNLVRQILAVVDEDDTGSRAQKEAALRLIAAFAIATKQHLRNETTTWQELEGLVSVQQFEILQRVNHPALEVAIWIEDYLQQQSRQGRLHPYQLPSMSQLLNQLVDNMGACERILRTPMPIAYSIHLKQLLMIYCLALPFPMVKDLGWFTGPIVALISFTLLGIEAIGLEIENPFGRDPNDLPLDVICATLRRNIEDLIRLNPDVARRAAAREIYATEALP